MPIDNPDPRTPVIIGVGQFLDRDSSAREPVDLMVEAIRAAEADTTRSGALTQTDVVAVVPTFSWRYRDPGALIRDRIGAPTSATWYATVGGNTPQLLVNRLAAAIARGELDQAVLCGGESGRTRRAAKRDGVTLDWSTQDDSVVPTWMDESPFVMAGPGELARNIVMPLQAYPLFENALLAPQRAEPRGSPEDRRRDVVGVLPGRRGEPVCVEPPGVHGRGDHDTDR